MFSAFFIVNQIHPPRRLDSKINGEEENSGIVTNNINVILLANPLPMHSSLTVLTSSEGNYVGNRKNSDVRKND
jgi:hypothetical protein